MYQQILSLIIIIIIIVVSIFYILDTFTELPYNLKFIIPGIAGFITLISGIKFIVSDNSSIFCKGLKEEIANQSKLLGELTNVNENITKEKEEITKQNEQCITDKGSIFSEFDNIIVNTNKFRPISSVVPIVPTVEEVVGDIKPLITE
jgi:hypothetical protein